MAKKISAKPMVASIHKTRVAVEKAQKASVGPEAARLALKVKKLKKLEADGIHICDVFFI